MSVACTAHRCNGLASDTGSGKKVSMVQTAAVQMCSQLTLHLPCLCHQLCVKHKAEKRRLQRTQSSLETGFSAV